MSKARPFLDSTDVVGDTNELRVRFDRDGYLFIRGLLPVAVLDDLRQEFNKLLRGAGWIAADSPLDDALADLSAFAVEPEPAYQAVYNQLYGVPAQAPWPSQTSPCVALLPSLQLVPAPTWLAMHALPSWV